MFHLLLQFLDTLYQFRGRYRSNAHHSASIKMFCDCNNCATQLLNVFFKLCYAFCV